MKLTEKYCFDKYGIGGINITGGGITAVAESNCATRSSKGTKLTTNNGKVIGRGNFYGRWIFVEHKATVRATYGSNNYFLSAYKRSSPNGGNV